MSGPSRSKSFTEDFLAEATEIIARLDVASIEKAAGLLASTRAAGGRLFILGVGGSAANASHAVNDFRKIAGIEAYAPTDNVSELTARANDEGWSSIFDGWLRVSRLRQDDLLLDSVGRWRKHRTECKSESGSRFKLREIDRDEDYRRGWPRRWLYREGCRRLRAHSNRKSCAHHSAHRGFSGGSLASSGFASRSQVAVDQMGIDGIAWQTPCRVSRPRRRDQQSFCSRRQAVSSAESAGTGSSSWST